MRSESSYGILGYIGGKLLAGTSEQEHADHAVRLPDPSRYFLAENCSGPAAHIITQSYPFRQAHLKRMIGKF